jgi:hypothetical protein
MIFYGLLYQTDMRGRFICHKSLKVIMSINLKNKSIQWRIILLSGESVYCIIQTNYKTPTSNVKEMVQFWFCQFKQQQS